MLLLPACIMVAALRPAAAFLLGLVLMSVAARVVIEQRLPLELEGRNLSLVAVVAEFPEQRGGAVRLIVESVRPPGFPQRIRLSWHQPATLPSIGETWRLEVRLRRPRGFANPGGFDYEGWLFRNGIGATGYVVADGDNLRVDERPRSVLTGYRRRMAERIEAALPDDDATAVLMAITIGARHGISQSGWKDYAATGTSHLMAISGLHIGLAAGFAGILTWLLLALAGVRGNLRDCAFIAAAGAAIAYALVSGFAVPARRAMLMTAIFATATVSRRRLQSGHVLALSCLLLLLLDPLASLAPGFQLSFAAVACLLASAAPLVRLPGRLPGGSLAVLFSAPARLGRMQMALLLGLFPLTVLIFDRATLVAPLANVVVLPIFNFVTVPAGLLAMLIDPLSAAGATTLLEISHESILLVLGVVSVLAELPGAGISVAQLAGPALLVALLPAMWVLLPRGWPGRHVAWLALAATLLHRPAAPPRGCVEITVLDVGQGLATVLRTAGHTLVYDTGPAFRGGGDAASLVVAPYLVGRGVRRFDTLIVSHADLDHSGGVSSLLERVPADRVLVGEWLERPDIAQERCVAGQRWHWDGITFTIRHPPPTVRFSGNDASCVLQVEIGDDRILLTGDVEARVERRLLSQKEFGRVSLVVVPHHGSRTSSSRDFVATLDADRAVVSAGYGNRWGFPKDDVVERWRTSGAEVLTTAETGAVMQRYCADGRRYPPRRHRAESRRFWSDP